MTKTVKARVHYGADSLDLTIPANICRKYNIESGDVFEVIVEEEDESLVLCYRRVYSKNST